MKKYLSLLMFLLVTNFLVAQNEASKIDLVCDVNGNQLPVVDGFISNVTVGADGSGLINFFGQNAFTGPIDITNLVNFNCTTYYKDEFNNVVDISCGDTLIANVDDGADISFANGSMIFTFNYNFPEANGLNIPSDSDLLLTYNNTSQDHEKLSLANLATYVNNHSSEQVGNSANNPLITLQRNGVSIGDFTLNQTNTETFNFIDNDTQLSESQVDAFVNNNGYLLTEVDGTIGGSEWNTSLDYNLGTIGVTDGGGRKSLDLSTISLSDFNNDLPSVSVNDPTITLNAGTLLTGGGNFTLNQTGNQTITFDASVNWSDLGGTIPNNNIFPNTAGYITSFTEIDGSLTNEIQTLSNSGLTYTLSNGGGSFTLIADTDTQLTETDVDAFVSNNGYITSPNDADSDPLNEIELPVGGFNGQVLQTDGSSNYSWVTPTTSANGIFDVSNDNGTWLANNIDLSNHVTLTTGSSVFTFSEDGTFSNSFTQIADNVFQSVIKGATANDYAELELSNIGRAELVGRKKAIITTGITGQPDLDIDGITGDMTLTNTYDNLYLDGFDQGVNQIPTKLLGVDATDKVIPVDLASLGADGIITSNTVTGTTTKTLTTTRSIGGNITETWTDLVLTEAQVDAFVNNNGYLTSFTEIDGSITNELQTLSNSGNTYTLSNGGGSFTLIADTNTQLTEAEVDAFVANNGYLTGFTEIDGSITNEIQTFSNSGNTYTLSDGGGSFTLSSYIGDAQTHTSGGNLLLANNNIEDFRGLKPFDLGGDGSEWNIGEEQTGISQDDLLFSLGTTNYVLNKDGETNPNDLTTKSYVDAAAAPDGFIGNVGTTQAGGQLDMEGNEIADIFLLDIRSTANALVSWQIQKTGDDLSFVTTGRTYVMNSSGPTNDDDVANKKYVDDNTKDVQYVSLQLGEWDGSGVNVGNESNTFWIPEDWEGNYVLTEIEVHPFATFAASGQTATIDVIRGRTAGTFYASSNIVSNASIALDGTTILTPNWTVASGTNINKLLYVDVDAITGTVDGISFTFKFEEI